MTKDERQALREKHLESQAFMCFTSELEKGGARSICSCGSFTWPCDVIKVLDATENLKPNDLKTKVECDHWVTVKRSGQYGYASSVSPEYWTHTFCPKCGVEL